MLQLYVVVIRDYRVSYCEFFWAEDADHAQEQAINAHPTSRFDAVALVPYVEARKEAP